jgi:O-antigen ligase
MGLETKKTSAMNDVSVMSEPSSSREYRFALMVSTILTTVFIGFAMFSRGDPTILAMFPLVAVILLSIVSFELSAMVLVITLFADYYTIGLSTAVLFSFVLGISFLLRHHDIKWNEFANPLTVPLAIYSVCALPSFFNATFPLLSAYKLLNVVGFLIVLYTMVGGIRSYSDLRKLFIVFVMMAAVNSLDVVRLSLVSEKRPFGFAGIWFVDYSALATCLMVAVALSYKGRMRFWSLLIGSLITLALILTQTRNTWISAILTLFVLVVFLAIRPEIIGISRKDLLKSIGLGILLISIVVLVALQINPKFAVRTSQLTEAKHYNISQTGEVGNSLISRLLIWDTALQAFKAHPVIGIGVYAFPYSSQFYYRIPKFLFKLYVEGSHPHQAYLAVLAETGILGILGFIFFIGSAVRYSVRAIYIAHDEDAKRFALLAFVGMIYCVISMFFTDAWLWGQQIILFGLVAGAAMTIYKLNLRADTELVSSRPLNPLQT